MGQVRTPPDQFEGGQWGARQRPEFGYGRSASCDGHAFTLGYAVDDLTTVVA